MNPLGSTCTKSRQSIIKPYVSFTEKNLMRRLLWLLWRKCTIMSHMSVMASQTTSYLTVCSAAFQNHNNKKNHSSALLGEGNPSATSGFPHQRPVLRKRFLIPLCLKGQIACEILITHRIFPQNPVAGCQRCPNGTYMPSENHVQPVCYNFTNCSNVYHRKVSTPGTPQRNNECRGTSMPG